MIHYSCKPRSWRRLSVWLLGVVLSFPLVPGEAQSQEAAQYQFWPELDVYYRFDAQWRLFTQASLTRAREVQYTDGQIGAAIDFSFYPIAPLIGVVSTDFERFRVFQFRAGYNYAQAIGDHSGDYREHRIAADASIRVLVTEYFLFSDRNRGDFRFVNGDFSFRYRNRIRMEHQVTTDLVTFNPYVSAEFFYDTRHETFNRTVFAAGIEWTFSARTVLEISYQRQNDTRSSPSAVNGFGLTLLLYY